MGPFPVSARDDNPPATASSVHRVRLVEHSKGCPPPPHPPVWNHALLAPLKACLTLNKPCCCFANPLT